MGAWIETVCHYIKDIDKWWVAPRVGAWIETHPSIPLDAIIRSRPAWARGLKQTDVTNYRVVNVAPRVGAWIETSLTGKNIGYVTVAPRVGAWIETSNNNPLMYSCGVAPRVGAWIETLLPLY